METPANNEAEVAEEEAEVNTAEEAEKEEGRVKSSEEDEEKDHPSEAVTSHLRPLRQPNLLPSHKQRSEWLILLSFDFSGRKQVREAALSRTLSKIQRECSADRISQVS